MDAGEPSTHPHVNRTNTLQLDHLSSPFHMILNLKKQTHKQTKKKEPGWDGLAGKGACSIELITRIQPSLPTVNEGTSY